LITDVDFLFVVLALDMTVFKRQFIGLIMALFLFTACKKEPKVTTNVWLPQELKDMFLFYPGSYWVFQLPGTDYEDSIFVIETILDTIPILHPGSREVIGYKERFSVKYASPFYGQIFEYRSESTDFCKHYGLNEPCHYVARQNYHADTVHRRTLLYGLQKTMVPEWNLCKLIVYYRAINC